ncbi:MAG: hypothetical protein GX456_16160, partial [Verrucomicrobia bacterium]|nr:hypothetical protein [Verrucomicrobiota bacterium]
AFGVRQLAAALFLCSTNVSVPMPRHPQNRFRVFRVFRGYNQPNYRSRLPESVRLHDTIPPRPQISPSHKTTTPKDSFG